MQKHYLVASTSIEVFLDIQFGDGEAHLIVDITRAYQVSGQCTGGSVEYLIELLFDGAETLRQVRHVRDHETPHHVVLHRSCRRSIDEL